MYKEIRQFLVGKMDSETFINFLITDSNVQREVKLLIPDDVKHNPNHPAWDRYSYESAEKRDFDCLRMIKSTCSFDNSFGDTLNLFSILRRFYCIHEPDCPTTSMYEDTFITFLDICGDLIDGPEVQKYIEEIIKEVLDIPQKSKRIKEGKRRVYEAFHIEGRNRPYWIQGAEWPMGMNSPMKYISSRRIHDGKVFVFTDADTGEIREVEQYY